MGTQKESFFSIRGEVMNEPHQGSSGSLSPPTRNARQERICGVLQHNRAKGAKSFHNIGLYILIGVAFGQSGQSRCATISMRCRPADMREPLIEPGPALFPG
ncbi:hypothetical protein ACVIIV_003193 [Bradyrhizobium sp. USDA 4354]